MNISKYLSQKSNDYRFFEDKYKKKTGHHLILDPFKQPVGIKDNEVPDISIVIPVWNAKDSILFCLASIEQSSFNQKYQSRLQIVIVDDGSSDGSWETIRKSSFLMNIIAVRQAHHGLAHARNTGISVSDGEIIVLCDSDIVLGYYAIEHLSVRHCLLPNVLLAGFRTDIDKKDIRIKFEHIKENYAPKDTTILGDMRIKYSCPGWPENMCLTSSHLKDLGNGKGLWMPDGGEPWLLPDLVFGALFSLPKEIYYRVGGYDERFYGWGCEDGHFAAKVITEGTFLIPVYAASGFHIKHSPRSKDQEANYKKNRRLFLNLLEKTEVGKYPNYLKKAKKKIIDSFIKSPNVSVNKVSKGSVSEINLTKVQEIETFLVIGEYSKALKLLKDLKLQAYDVENYLLQKGLAYQESGKTRQAIDTFQKLVNIVGYKPKSSIMLAVAQANDGQFFAANSTFKKAGKRRPDNSYLSYYQNSSQASYQGENYFSQGFFKVAKRCFEAVLISNPKSKKAIKYRNLCIKKLN